MILTCDRKIINIYFRIVIIEVVIQPIITTIVLVVFTTITPTLFLYVIFYLRWIHECDDVLIELSKTIPTYSSTTIIITTCMGSFFSHSQRNFFSYDYINGRIFYLHWTCDYPPIKRKYWFRIVFKSSSLSERVYTKINS